MIQFVLDTDRELFEEALRFAQHQVRRLIENYPDVYPIYTNNGRWKQGEPAWTSWCDGFLPGLLWIFQKRSAAANGKDTFWLDQAIRYTSPLEARKQDPEKHDLGFLFFSTYYRWYRLTRDPRLRDVLIEAGRTEALRFKDRGQYLRSFVGDNSIFIDMMMNVGIVFYTARETGDRKLRDLAVRHCLTTRRVLVRGDGSTAQEGIFDVETGEFLHQRAQQGYRADSCWSRGLAWALYGFSVSYEYSHDPRLLATAAGCADYYVTHASSDGICPWDFNAPPETRSLPDTSAAAIAASGMLRLCRLVHDPVQGHFYWSTAIRILRALCEKHLAKSDKKWEGILKGGMYHLPRELGVDESVIWGEYFFVEAIEQALAQLA